MWLIPIEKAGPRTLGVTRVEGSGKQAWCQDAQLEHQGGRDPGLHCGLSFPCPGLPGSSVLCVLQGVLPLSQAGPVTFCSSLQIYSWRVLEMKLCSTFV